MLYRGVISKFLSGLQHYLSKNSSELTQDHYISASIITFNSEIGLVDRFLGQNRFMSKIEKSKNPVNLHKKNI